MELIFKAVIVGAVGAVLTLLIKRTNPEISVVLAFACCALIGSLALKAISEVMEVLRLAARSGALSAAYTAPVLKCVGIGVTAKLGADLCRDAGQSAVAGTVELCGAGCALYVSLPLIKTLLTLLGELT